jgi:hypothetical protein
VQQWSIKFENKENDERGIIKFETKEELVNINPKNYEPRNNNKFVEEEFKKEGIDIKYFIEYNINGKYTLINYINYLKKVLKEVNIQSEDISINNIELFYKYVMIKRRNNINSIKKSIDDIMSKTIEIINNKNTNEYINMINNCRKKSSSLNMETIYYDIYKYFMMDKKEVKILNSGNYEDDTNKSFVIKKPVVHKEIYFKELIKHTVDELKKDFYFMEYYLQDMLMEHYFQSEQKIS